MTPRYKWILLPILANNKNLKIFLALQSQPSFSQNNKIQALYLF